MIKHLFNDEGGFTLIELLVTIAILGVMFGIVTLTLSGVGSDAQTTVCAAEVGVVQAAMDIWLAVDAGNSITGDPTPANTIVGTNNVPPSAFTDYIQGTTEGTYTYNAGGETLVQVACP